MCLNMLPDPASALHMTDVCSQQPNTAKISSVRGTFGVIQIDVANHEPAAFINQSHNWRKHKKASQVRSRLFQKVSIPRIASFSQIPGSCPVPMHPLISQYIAPNSVKQSIRDGGQSERNVNRLTFSSILYLVCNCMHCCMHYMSSHQPFLPSSSSLYCPSVHTYLQTDTAAVFSLCRDGCLGHKRGSRC